MEPDLAEGERTKSSENTFGSLKALQLQLLCLIAVSMAINAMEFEGLKKPFISMEDFHSQFTSDEMLALKKHFDQMVTGEHGTSYVGNEDDIFFPKFVEMLLAIVVGKSGAKFIKVTGSASQNLKCVSENEQGDADMLFLSNFPKMTKEDQENALVPCDDPGFYKIKQLNARKYPFVKRDGINFLNANSLRNFEAIWFARALQLPLLVVESLEHEFERAGRDQVASVLSWRSTTHSKFNALSSGYLYKNIQYFYMLSRSYKEHVLPILDDSAKKHAERVIDVFIRITNISLHYGSSRAKKGYEAVKQLGSDFDNGIVPAALGFYRDNDKLAKSYIDANDLPHFIEGSKYFEMIIAEELGSQEPSLIEESNKLQGSFDIVPALSCEGFPMVAKNWQERVKSKLWPHPDVVSKVLEAGYHLVPKPSKNPKSDSSTTFRLSFHEGETLLAQSLTQFQRECFRIFKMYFYEKLKRQPKVLTTYHLKTVFFWLLEQTDPEVWKEENRAYCSSLLLQSLAFSLKTMTLKHYFIPENNLLEYFDKQAVYDVMRDLENIIADPIGASGPKIEQIKQFYSKKADDIPATDEDVELDKFFERSKNLFEKAIQRVQSPEVQASFKLSDEIVRYLKSALHNESKHRILRFMFDLIFARKCQARYSQHFSKYAPLPSPIAMLVQAFLPVSDEIMKDVFLPQIAEGTRIKKKFQEIDGVLKIASLLSYEDLLNFALLKSSFSVSPENRIDSIAQAIMQLTGFHDEL